MKDQYGDVSVTKLEGHVVQVEIQRPPNNFFDHQLIMDIADCFEDADKDKGIRAIVLCSEGKHFCAGANFGSSDRAAELEKRTEDDRNPLYDEAVAVVTETRKASISYVQRRLKIGYNRAARMIEEMEVSGVVSQVQSNGSREVLAPPPPSMEH